LPYPSGPGSSLISTSSSKPHVQGLAQTVEFSSGDAGASRADVDGRDWQLAASKKSGYERLKTLIPGKTSTKHSKL
jgi:hypothetical protein